MSGHLLSFQAACTKLARTEISVKFHYIYTAGGRWNLLAIYGKFKVCLGALHSKSWHGLCGYSVLVVAVGNWAGFCLDNFGNPYNGSCCENITK